MLEVCRRLALGLALILGAAALLLVSDLGSRKSAAKKAQDRDRPVKISLTQPASQAVLDDAVRGVVDALGDRGFVDGQTMQLKKSNAEGDTATGAAIARDMANGDADLLITVSTLALQSVANANKTTQKRHVFGVVSDPWAAGVGLSRENPLDHPAWMAGFGTMQPVEPAFKIARAMKPDLKRVGVVWNAAEANSEAQIEIARKVCASLGIELMEATIDSSAGVGEAAAALVARGVEAIFLPGDVMVMVGADQLIAAANKNGVAVFSVIPPNARKGALFDIGADYYEVGRHAGELAADVLDGLDPAKVEIVNYLPESVIINEQALAELAKNGWRLPESVRQRAKLIIAPDGKERPGLAAKAVAEPAPKLRRDHPWKLYAIMYTESPPAEEAVAGLREGMAKWPLVEGRDYTFKLLNAQGDVGTLNSLVDAALTDGADIIIPISTPSLQAAIRKVKDRPVIFTLIANPVIVGAGKSFDDHLPNVTGVSVLAPTDEMLDLLRKHFPQYRRLGTLFCPAEANSVDLKDTFVAHARDRGFEVETVAVSTPTELPDAAMSLAGRPIDAIVQISDNITSAGFTAIARAANQTQKPLFSLNSTTTELGAPVSFGRDYHECGLQTAKMVLRVMDGESPAKIPFLLSPHVVKKASLPNAAKNGLVLPQGYLDEMETVIRP
ncbi:MAG TPA: ABC transporter substrate-binding protein [Chthoniobacterales bacterium]